MYNLPITVTIDGNIYNIRNKADYRTILDVIALFDDFELTEEEKTICALIIFYEGVDTIEDVFNLNVEKAGQEMMNFISCYSNQVGHKVNRKLMDWVQDEHLIVSAVNNVAKTEIRALEYLHWYTFIGYYMAIGESSFSTVVSIRDKIARGKKLEKYEQEFKRENPEYFIWKNQELESENILNEIWNKEG